jgi:hypothetical protein
MRGHGGVRFLEFQRYEAVGQHELAAFPAKPRDRQGGSRLKGADRAKSVHTRQGSGEHPQILRVFKVRGMPTLPWKQGVAKARVVKQGGTCPAEWRDHGQFGVFELGRERVFFENLGIRPAPRAIELRYQKAAVFQFDLVDAVFVAVEFEKAACGRETGGIDRIKDEIGGKPCERCGR